MHQKERTEWDLGNTQSSSNLSRATASISDVMALFGVTATLAGFSPNTHATATQGIVYLLQSGQSH